MGYSPFVEVDPTVIAKLSFNWELCNYVYHSNSNGTMKGQLYEVGENVYEKIKDVLSGSDIGEIKKKDRVYVLAGNDLPKKRIKEFLKSKGAYMTSELEKADVILGNDNVAEYAYGQASMTSMMFRSDDYLAMSQENSDMTVEQSIMEISGLFHRELCKISEDYDEGIHCILSDYGYMHGVGYDQNAQRFEEERFFLYPITVNVLFKVLSSRIPVLSQSYLNDLAHSDLDIADPEVYSNIKNMLQSSDDSNIELGVEILVHSKLPDSPRAWYHTWRLAKEYGYSVNSRDRNKNVQFFIKGANWNNLRYLSTAEYVVKCEEEGTLDREIFELLLTDIQEDERDDFRDSKFYELTHEGPTGFVYRLKPEWMKYLKEEKEVKQTIEEDDTVTEPL